ncbi:MAG: S8 family serine peptidase [Blastocatellia bacterium]
MSQKARKTSTRQSPPTRPVENRLAVRYRDGAERELARRLAGLGDVREVKSHRLFVVEFKDARACDAAAEQIQQWKDEGLIEFVTPVLRDAGSQSIRIVTDEISVRFKSVLPARKLKSFAKKFGVVISRQNEFVPTQYIVTVKDPEGLRTLEVANRLAASDEVEFAAPNYISEYRH